MRKERILYSVGGKILDSLNFVVIEHSGIAPSSFVEHVVSECRLGVVLLGTDGPCTLSATQAQKIADAFNRQRIHAITIGRLIWFQHKDALNLFKLGEFDGQGDALMLKLNPPEEGLTIPSLPRPAGAKGDKITMGDARLLDRLLCENELYVHDDFTDCLIVAKGKKVFDLILKALGGLADGDK